MMSDFWAEVNSDGVVVNVVCGADEWIAEQDNADAYFPTDPNALDYAGIGYTWEANRARFIPPSPFPSWVYDDAGWCWTAPTPYPEDGEWVYDWDEEQVAWVAVEPVVRPDEETP